MPSSTLLLRGVRFATFEQLALEIENPGLRLTYDRGRLEIMSPSGPHEKYKKLLARLIETMTEELGIPIATGGSTTFRRADLEKGIEPDECYWVLNEARMRGRFDFDLRVDPPPDLVLEAEVSRTVIDRLEILSALGVPEIWRYDGARITVLLRSAEGMYQESPTSRCFPWLSMAGLCEYLGRYGETDESSWVRGFRRWARDRWALRSDPQR